MTRMSESRQYEPITEKEHSEIEELLLKAVEQFRREKISEDSYSYVVELQSSKFITEMTDNELAESARLTVDILEELKKVNNKGIHREELEKIEMENDRDEPSGGNVRQTMGVFKAISTDRLSGIINELDDVRRVGGAYAMILANPCLISAINAVFWALIDSFDDDTLYLRCCFFLMRAVMRMHSNEYE